MSPLTCLLSSSRVQTPMVASQFLEGVIASPCPKCRRACLGNGSVHSLLSRRHRGYISQPLFEELYQRGLQLVTKARKNMKQRLVKLIDKILLRKRAILESVNDQLKNICQIEHSRHRSGWNFLVNLLAGRIAYTYQPKCPSLDLQPKGLSALPPAIF